MKKLHVGTNAFMAIVAASVLTSTEVLAKERTNSKLMDTPLRSSESALIKKLDDQLVTNEKELPSISAVQRATSLAKQYNNLRQYNRSDRAWTRASIAASQLSDVHALSSVYSEWANTIAPFDLERAERYKLRAVSVLGLSKGNSDVRETAQRDLINFYQAHGSHEQATKAQASLDREINVIPAQNLPLRCAACGRG